MAYTQTPGRGNLENKSISMLSSGGVDTDPNKKKKKKPTPSENSAKLRADIQAGTIDDSYKMYPTNEESTIKRDSGESRNQTAFNLTNFGSTKTPLTVGVRNSEFNIGTNTKEDADKSLSGRGTSSHKDNDAKMEKMASFEPTLPGDDYGQKTYTYSDDQNRKSIRTVKDNILVSYGVGHHASDKPGFKQKNPGGRKAAVRNHRSDSISNQKRREEKKVINAADLYSSNIAKDVVKNKKDRRNDIDERYSAYTSAGRLDTLASRGFLKSLKEKD